jgi:hypothetical protein
MTQMTLNGKKVTLTIEQKAQRLVSFKVIPGAFVS